MFRSSRAAAVFFLMAAPLSAASIVDGSFALQDSKTLPGWKIEGHWLMDLRKAEPRGLEVFLKKVPSKFNEAAFTSTTFQIPMGTWRATLTLGGDPGVRVYLGMRLTGEGAFDLSRSDRWETLAQGEKQITAKYELASDATARLILAFGVAENDGKRLFLRDLVLERVSDAPSLAEKRIGAGAEYDGIILPKESETRETNRLGTRVAVDETRRLRAVSPLLFGYNHDGPSDNWVLFKDNRIDDSVMALCKGIPMPVNRIQAFGYYATTRWKQCLGPFEQREAVKMNEWEKEGKKAYGPAEALDLCLRIDPSARFTWNIHVKSDEPEDSADLVEFLTGDGRKPRGAVNWAQRRIEGGVAKPVSIVAYEMGNEVDWANPPKRMGVQEYIDRSLRHLEAIRRVDPDAKIALHAATAPWAYQQRFKEDWRDWHRAILRQLGDRIDFISFHPYYSGLPISMVEGYLDALRDDIRSITGTNRVKIFISEHATWPGDIAKRDTWYQVLTLSAALSVTHFLGRLLAREEVELATFHCFTHGGGLWGLLDVGKETKARYTTVFADLFKMLRRGLGDEVLACETTGEKLDSREGEKSLFSATAMGTRDGLRLLLVNREPAAPRSIDFAFAKRYTVVKETTFTAPSMRSHNTEFITNQFVTEKTMLVDASKPYLMPPKSAVILELARK